MKIFVLLVFILLSCNGGKRKRSYEDDCEKECKKICRSSTKLFWYRLNTPSDRCFSCHSRLNKKKDKRGASHPLNPICLDQETWLHHAHNHKTFLNFNHKSCFDCYKNENLLKNFPKDEKKAVEMRKLPQDLTTTYMDLINVYGDFSACDGEEEVPSTKYPFLVEKLVLSLFQFCSFVLLVKKKTTVIVTQPYYDTQLHNKALNSFSTSVKYFGFYFALICEKKKTTISAL